MELYTKTRWTDTGKVLPNFLTNCFAKNMTVKETTASSGAGEGLEL
jgi:hypothetical protein